MFGKVRRLVTSQGGVSDERQGAHTVLVAFALNDHGIAGQSLRFGFGCSIHGQHCVRLAPVRRAFQLSSDTRTMLLVAALPKGSTMGHDSLCHCLS